MGTLEPDDLVGLSLDHSPVFVAVSGKGRHPECAHLC
jgi:hypothetical protein